LLSWLLLVCRLSLPAQSPAYVHYGVAEGLPSNKVYCALQDYRGFIWFGTDKGLAHFDGTRFQVFGVKDGLPDPEVLNLFEDSHHRIWISSFSQRPCYMLDGRVFTATNDSLLGKINVESSLWVYTEDSAHRLWIASKTTSVFVFDGEKISENKYPSSVLRMEQIGQLQFALGTKSIIQNDIGLNFNLHPASNFFNSIAVSGNRILYVFAGELVLLEWTGEKIVEVDRLNYTEGRVFTDQQGRFWLCPDSKGAICFENFRHDLSMPVHYLKQEQVNAMMEDKQGTLWFCTSGRGVFGLSPGKAATYTQVDGLLINNITALARDAHGTILAGDDGGNLYKFSGRKRQRIPLDTMHTYNRCRQIVCLPGDSIWVANDKDLFCLHGDWIHSMHNKNRLSGFKSILAQSSLLWYGNHNALGYLNPNQLEPTIIMYQRTTALGQDADGNIWAGGLDRFHSQSDNFQFNWVSQFPLLKSRIVAIENAGAGKIWIVTPDAGLLLGTVQQGKLTGLEIVNQYLKHPIENIQTIFVESEAPYRLWMATNKGVYGLNPANWNVVHFDQHDGLADNDVNCVLVAQDTLWAGTVAGLSCLPLSAPNGDDDFGTFVTGLHYQAAGHPVFLNLLDSLGPFHRVVLPPDAAMVTLNLAGLNYRSQGNLVYECITTKLVPPLRWWTRQNLFNFIKNSFQNVHDTTMIDGKDLNFGISFPSGSYQLQITAITAQGVSSQHPDHWTIVMRPGWYSTIWFDLLVWMLIAYALWRILRARTVYRKLNVAVSELQLQALQS
ncbi:MAG: two-component regulator propeller domain-containing protein, partial [Saprospiraceae bacterium]